MSVLFAILLFSALIFVHELGHFVTAKLSGVQVNEFSVFMGPALWKKQVGPTLYAIRLIPIGGFCAMEGEDDPDCDSPHSFERAATWKKICILLAGAAMNFLVGVILMVIVYAPVQQVAVPVIGSFEEYATINGTEGLQEGDEILEIDGERVYVYSDITLLLSLKQGAHHDFLVQRNGEKVQIRSLNMEKHPVTLSDGSQGMLYGMNFTIDTLNLGGKLSYAWAQCLDAVRMVRLSLGMLLTGQAGLSDMSGPVGIVQQMSEVADASATNLDALMNMLYFGGFIAINLAVMNLLPIPALDGGRIVCILLSGAIQLITGKKLDPKYEAYLNGAGMILLLGLMAVIMFKDIFVLFMR